MQEWTSAKQLFFRSSCLPALGFFWARQALNETPFTPDRRNVKMLNCMRSLIVVLLFGSLVGCSSSPGTGATPPQGTAATPPNSPGPGTPPNNPGSPNAGTPGSGNPGSQSTKPNSAEPVYNPNVPQ